MAETINIPSGLTRVFVRPYGFPGAAVGDPSGTTRYAINGGSWLTLDTSTTPDTGVTGDITFVASENQTNSVRSLTLTITATTSPDERYDGTASVTCAYTITQAAGSTPPGPTPTYDRHILFKIGFTEIGTLNGRPTVSVFCRPSSSSAYINRDWVVSQGQTYAEFDIQLGDSATITYVDMIGAQVVNQVPPGDTEYQLQITFPDGHSEPWPAAQGSGTIPAYYDKNQVEFVVTSTVGQTQYMQIDVHAQVRGN